VAARGLSTSAARLIRPSPARLAGQGKLTSDKYPELKRDPRFTQLSPDHVAYFKELLGSPSAVIDGVSAEAEADIEPFNEDWLHKYRGQCRLVLKPASTDEVSKILRYCNEQRLAVVPQGGNTGLVGGSVPVFDEIVISMGRMNEIHSFDEVSGALVVDAGVILEVADQFLAQKGYIFPLDLGAKGSCHVGGNVATNAGGLRLLRYGSLHGSVLGVEAVLPDGTVMNDLCTLRKNNTGYDLKQLHIGAEGTIGIITKVAIQCPQRSSAINVAFFGLESFDKVQLAFREAKKQLGEILSAFELMDSKSQNLVYDVRGGKKPLDDDHPFYCLIETSGSNGDHDYEKLEKFLEDVMTKEIITDGVVAQDETQLRSLWSWREGIPECLGHWGGTYKYDVSIPIADLYALVDETQARMDEAGLVGPTDEHPAVGVVGYGHMGDSNLHLNIAVRRYDGAVEKVLEPFVYEWIASRNGSISAEHGLGIAKKNFIGFSRDETSIQLMKQIKNLYDPVRFTQAGTGTRPHGGDPTATTQSSPFSSPTIPYPLLLQTSPPHLIPPPHTLTISAANRRRPVLLPCALSTLIQPTFL
jgi:FAD/FMN-containing dehydrogenase